MQDAILILDHDVALAGLIARTLRSQQIYCEPVPFDVPLARVMARAPRGLIIAAAQGQTVGLDRFDTALLTAGLPILALGGAAASLCAHLGGAAARLPGERDADAPDAQEGVTPAERDSVTLWLEALPLFEGIGGGERVLRGLFNLTLPDAFTSIATATEQCIGFVDGQAQLYGVQYPIERNDPDAVQLLRNFACAVCGMEPVWTEENIISQAVLQLQQAAGDGRVLVAVSGGVDSAVCAKLARMAVGDRLMCVFVDTGLFRAQEPETVIQTYMETLGLVVAYADAGESFLKALRGVRAPQEKERIASSLLGQVLYKQLRYDTGAHTLVLGTNLNDVLYGELPPAETPPEGDNGQAVRIAEPLRGLFKDEVRRLARALALPATIAERQPFPASGLALRILGEVTHKRLAMLRQADAFFSEEVRATGHERRLWQYYATMCENPDHLGGYVVILRACQACSGDACASRLPYDLLERVTARIMEAEPQITRVLYDLTPSAQYALVE